MVRISRLVRESVLLTCLVGGALGVFGCTYTATNDSSGEPVDMSNAALSPSASARIIVGSAAHTVAAGQCSPVVKLNRVNDEGVLQPTPSFMTIPLAGPGYTFYSDPGCTNVVTTSFLGANTHTNDVYYRNSTPGLQPLAVGASGHDGHFQLQTITGTPAPAARIRIGSSPKTVDVGQCSTVVKLNRVDASGQVVVTPTFMEIPLSGPGFTFYTDPGCTNAISMSWLGVGTHTNDIYFKNSLPGSQPLSVGASGHSGDSQMEIVGGGAAPIVRLAIGTAPQTLDAGQCSSVVKIHRHDDSGNLAPTPTYMDIQLSGEGFSFFSDPGCTNAVTASFLGAGTHTNDIYFANSMPGSRTITISAAGHEPASQVETIAGGGGAPQPGPGTPYNLSELPVEYRPALPAAPVTNSQVNPTTAAALASAGQTPGRRVIVNTNLSGADIHIQASDIELEVQPAGRIRRVTIAAGVSRIRVDGGGTIQELIMSLPSGNPATDVHIDGVRFDSPWYADWGGTSMELRGHRIAVTNCITESHRYSIWADSDGYAGGQDILIANNDFLSHCNHAGGSPPHSESTVRLVGFDRSAVLNNRLENGSKHNYRIHGSSVRYYAANNVLVGSGFMLGTMEGDDLDYGIFRNHYIHWLRNGFADLQPSTMFNFVLTTNQAYATGWGCLWCGTPPSHWTVDNPAPVAFACPIPRLPGAQPGLTCTQ
jgi:hypothetical protein